MGNKTNFPAILRRFRKDKKLTQGQAASIGNVSRASWGSYEEGRSEPSMQTLINLAKSCRLTIDEFLGMKWTYEKVNTMILSQYNRATSRDKKIVDIILNLNRWRKDGNGKGRTTGRRG